MYRYFYNLEITADMTLYATGVTVRLGDLSANQCLYYAHVMSTFYWIFYCLMFTTNKLLMEAF